METLGEDLLALLFDKVDASDDRKSLSLVCKQWLKVEGASRSTLRAFEPDRLPKFLPRFPNLLKFRTSIEIPNSAIEFLVNTCPGIQVLNLNYHKEREGGFICVNTGLGDFDDEGLRCIAKGFPELETVLLRKRFGTGNVGVSALGEFSKKLRVLDLGWCRRVSDGALESVSELHNLEVLNLQGCHLITDAGLRWLADGYSSNTLTCLNVADCDQITDRGVIELRHIVGLEELNLSDCGPKVTDLGIEMGVAVLISLKKLNLSWLVSVSDQSMFALTRCCWKLEVLDLTGCESVTAVGIRSLAGYMSLRELVFTRCYCDVTGNDLEQVVFGCSTLEYIALDGRLRSWIPKAIQENISKRNCIVDWKDE